MKPKYKLFLLMLFILCNCFAQNKFKYQTFTNSVVKDGFYQINLLPEIIGKSNHLDDIRLLNNENKQIPYLIKIASPTFKQYQFIALKKIPATKKTDSTKITIENSNKIVIDNLVLILKNSLAERSVNINGSDDLKHWYAIREFINLEMTRDDDETHFVQSISLPTVDYKYLQIQFNDTQHIPMLIEQVGSYKNKKQLNNYFIIPAPIIKQNDSSDKLSYVSLIFKDYYRIDKLQLFVSGQKYYERNISFPYIRKDPPYFPEVYVISSKSNNTFYKTLHKYDDKKFTIQNNDNPPLKIDSVKAYQNAYALFAYLKAGQKYKLMFGNDSLASPVYDIPAFSDSIKNATVLQTGEIISNQIAESKTVVKNKSLNKIWLWTAIITVLLILLYFTSTMLKQINKKQQSDF